MTLRVCYIKLESESASNGNHFVLVGMFKRSLLTGVWYLCMAIFLDEVIEVHLQPAPVSRRSNESYMRSVSIYMTLQFLILALGDLTDGLVDFAQCNSVTIRQPEEKGLHCMSQCPNWRSVPADFQHVVRCQDNGKRPDPGSRC